MAGGKDSEETAWRRFAERLSFRNVVLSAALLLVVGVGCLIASSVPQEPSLLERIGSAIGEAFFVSGLTTLILIIAFSNRIEIKAAVTDAFEGLEGRLHELSAPAPPPVRVLARTQIYAHSIELLHSLGEGDGCTVRILMSAEEDLTADETSAAAGEGEEIRTKIGEDGQRWLDQLCEWLDDGDGNRELKRVIAIPREGFGERFDRAKHLLLEPFSKHKATQWFMFDDDFSISVMLLGRRYALFGFPEKSAGADSVTPFQYAAVIDDETLVDYLDSWFDERFVGRPDAVKVMDKGAIQEESLDDFWTRNK